MDEQIRQIAERLRGLRDVLELTADDIARDCDISAEEYRLAETGQRADTLQQPYRSGVQPRTGRPYDGQHRRQRLNLKRRRQSILQLQTAARHEGARRQAGTFPGDNNVGVWWRNFYPGRYLLPRKTT